MRIAFIVSEFPVLSETFILNQITGLLDAGHEVEIFSRVPAHAAKVHPDVEKYQLRRRTHYFIQLPHSRIMRFLKALALAAVNFYKGPVMVLRALNIFHFHSVRMIYALIPFLGKKFDILHCHFGPNGVLGVSLKDIGVAGKVLTSFHGYDVNNYPHSEGKDVYTELFKKGGRFTANTQFTKQQAVQLGCPAQKIDILHESLDVRKFRFKTKRLSQSETIQLLTIGRLAEKKGHAYALQAIAKVIENHKNIRYIIAGDGPLRERLKTQVSELRLEQHVTFTGSIDQEEAIALYAQAHIFILPSVTAANQDREGQALVLQEAQACGLPVLSTLHNGIPEGVLNGTTGFLVPEADSEALAERLEYLMSHHEIWADIGRTGREFVEKKFDCAVVNQKLLAIYQDMVTN